MHNMKVKQNYFDLIKAGIKIYEVRLNDEKRRLIKVGDTITIQREPELIESIDVKVKNLLYFDTFDEMVKVIPLDKIGFNTETPKEVVDTYHKFYSIEEEKLCGVVAIEIEV